MNQQTSEKPKTNRLQHLLSRNFAGLLEEFSPLTINGDSIYSLETLAFVISNLSQEDYCRIRDEGAITHWLDSVVRDIRLSRQLRNIGYKNNAVNIIRKRILEIKEYIRHPEKSFMYKHLNMYIEKRELFCDYEKCVQCGICTQVCPKEALEINEYLKVNDKCSLCSLCTAFCPTGALTFLYNGHDHNTLQDLGHIPPLPSRSEINGWIVKRYLEGTIDIEGPCPEHCEDCVSVCPVQIISRCEGDTILETAELDEDQCINCGACQRACPEQIIKLKRTDIQYEGEQDSDAWLRVLEKIIGPEFVNIYLSRKDREKLEQFTQKSGLVKYEGLMGKLSKLETENSKTYKRLVWFEEL